jgi:hypothetical protein
MDYMMSPPIARSFWNLTPFNTKLKASTMSNRKTTQSRWSSKMHLIPWIITSHLLLVTIPNWCEEKCVTKASRKLRHKAWLVSQYNVSPTIMGRTPPKGLVMAKNWTTPRICAIWHGMWPCVIWEQSWNNCENTFTESFVFKNHPKRVAYR